MPTINIDAITNLDQVTKEAYKSLRTNIEFCGSDVNVIAFTSFAPNEGKSSVSLNLAASFAELGKKVVLVDADMRKSVMVKRLELQEKSDGLSSFLARKCSLKDIVSKTNVYELDMILAGTVPPNPSELLRKDVFAKLIGFLREHYDYVIVDTPPLGSVVDSAIIAKHCDGIVIVTAADMISRRSVKNIKQQLEFAGCKILGSVLNKVDANKNKYYGKYYGQSYGKYYG